MSERQTKAPTMSALLPSRLVPEDMLSEWQGPNLPNTKNYAPPEDSIGGMIRNALLSGVAGVGGFTGLPMSGEGDRAALLGELLAAGMPLVGGVKQLAKLVGAENKVAQGIKAFHGSPHDFPPVRELMMPDGVRVYQHMNDALPAGAKMIKEHPLGRFDMSKIGTGEGAQAYGHGLYFAETEDVATGYRDALAPQFEVGGKPVVSAAQIRNDPKAINRVQDLWGYINSLKMDDLGSAKLYAARLDAMESTSDEMRQLMDSWQRVKAAPTGQINKDRGHMYEVNIDADPEDFLDWDAPLSQQSEKVRQAIQAAGVKPENKMLAQLRAQHGGEYPTGADTYAAAKRAAGGHPVMDSGAGATEALKQAGIPGIKYLDGASRSAGQGSRNYVVFDDKLISIVKKYGIAGALSAGAINELEARQLQAQGYQ